MNDTTDMVPTNGTGKIAAATLERVLLDGNLSGLNSQQRVEYMTRVCDSLGLNPLTKPFEFLTFQGKMVMYARRDCTEQLRKIHGVSVTIAAREETAGCYVVTARAQDAKGRHDESIGAVTIQNLTGEARSNAMMKAETKAKRRVTLSICGLGMLDESEADSIPGAKPVEYTPPPAKEAAPADPKATTVGASTAAPQTSASADARPLPTGTTSQSNKPARADTIAHDGNLATGEQITLLHTLKSKLQMGDCDGSCSKEVQKFSKRAKGTVPKTVYCVYHTQLAAFKDEDGLPCKSSKDLSRAQISNLISRYQERVKSQAARAEDVPDVSAIVASAEESISLEDLLAQHLEPEEQSGWLASLFQVSHVQELSRDDAETAFTLASALGTSGYDDLETKARAMGKCR